MSREDMPGEIRSLIAQCEANVTSFTNVQMSDALYWGEKLHAALTHLMERIEHFGVMGVYFTENAFGEDSAALAEANHVLSIGLLSQQCLECGGAGVVDSGGTNEHGEFISVPCGTCALKREAG